MFITSEKSVIFISHCARGMDNFAHLGIKIISKKGICVAGEARPKGL